MNYMLMRCKLLIVYECLFMCELCENCICHLTSKMKIQIKNENKISIFKFAFIILCPILTLEIP